MMHQGDPGGDHRPPLHDVGPPGPEALGAGADDAGTVLGQLAFWRRDSTWGPMKPSRAGQQGQGGDHGEGHAEGGGHGQAVEERHPEGEHPEQGDAHDDAGEQHGPARGVHRVHDRRFDIAARR